MKRLMKVITVCLVMALSLSSVSVFAAEETEVKKGKFERPGFSEMTEGKRPGIRFGMKKIDKEFEGIESIGETLTNIKLEKAEWMEKVKDGEMKVPFAGKHFLAKKTGEVEQ